MADRKLRVQAVQVQVFLVWDDGEELTPGPDLAPVSLPLSKAREMIAGLPDEVEKLAARLAEDEPAAQ